MVLPLVPVVAALNAGGHLVAHFAGGLIVYSTASGGYVAGTYIGTGALASFLTGSTVALGVTGTAAITGAAIWAYGTLGGAMTTLIGSAGLFGTTIGATGLTGFLMSVGILPAIPVFVPIAIGLGVLGLAALISGSLLRARSVRRLREKVVSAKEGEELQFSPKEAKVAERVIRSLSNPHNWLWRKWMQFFGRKRVNP